MAKRGRKKSKVGRRKMHERGMHGGHDAFSRGPHMEEKRGGKRKATRGVKRGKKRSAKRSAKRRVARR